MENPFLLHLVLNKRSACWVLAGASLAPFQGQRASARQLAGRAWRRFGGRPGYLGCQAASPASASLAHTHQPRSSAPHVQVLMALCLRLFSGRRPRVRSSDCHEDGPSASLASERKALVPTPCKGSKKQEEGRGCGQSSRWSSEPTFPAAPGAAGR